jgi:hypothetical protein
MTAWPFSTSTSTLQASVSFEAPGCWPTRHMGCPPHGRKEQGCYGHASSPPRPSHASRATPCQPQHARAGCCPEWLGLFNP